MKAVRLIPWLLVIGLLTGWVLWQQSRPSSAPQALPELPSFAADAVAAIDIDNPGKTSVHLKKQADGWYLVPGAGNDTGTSSEPVRAATDAVEHLLADLAAMRPVRVVSHKPEHYARLGVDEHGGTHLRLLDAGNQPLLDAYIGKPATDLVTTYLRLASGDAAVTVNRSLSWQVRRMPDAWKAPEKPVARDGYSQP